MMEMIISCGQQKGQGLLEILIVAFIVMVTSVALIQFQAAIIYKNSLALQQSDATILAVQQLELLRDYDVLYGQTGLTGFDGMLSSTSGTQLSTPIDNTNFVTTWTVATANNTVIFGASFSQYYEFPVKENTLDVTVTWNDIRGNSQNITLSTQISGLLPAPAFAAALFAGTTSGYYYGAGFVY